MIGQTNRSSTRAYGAFITKGISAAPCPDLVEKTPKKANEHLAEKTKLKAVDPDLDGWIEKVAIYFNNVTDVPLI